MLNPDTCSYLLIFLEETSKSSLLYVNKFFNQIIKQNKWNHEEIIQNEYFNILQWIQYDWNENTCAFAAKYKKLDILQYLRNNQCPWNEKTFYWSLFSNNENIINWILENNCSHNSNNLCLELRHPSVARFYPSITLTSKNRLKILKKISVTRSIDTWLIDQNFHYIPANQDLIISYLYENSFAYVKLNF